MTSLEAKNYFQINISLITQSTGLRYMFLLLALTAILAQAQPNGCYDEYGRPQMCEPEFENIAYERSVIVTNTCGDNGPREYCTQSAINTRLSNPTECVVCDKDANSHSAEFLTDQNNANEPTWWQSDTMELSIQYPNSVNLTLHFGKSYVITYIQMRFQSPRPESFAIYKRNGENSDWIPYQYYSSDCSIYNKSKDNILTFENETAALCTDEYSDITPLSGGNVAFSTLESRPNAFRFDETPELKDFVTATDIRITLNRLNTYGDDVFGDPKVLKSYYYAISDLAIGARCKCNGHARVCNKYPDANFEDKYKCECEHNTAGVDCERCAPFFNNKPWSPASLNNANACEPCNCNGLSSKCIFNVTLYEQTGEGGHCIDCERNTEGPHCEFCKFGSFKDERDDCVDCRCHPLGAATAQCDPSGACKCRPGVTGDKCDRCMAGHYDLSATGCKTCQCDEGFSVDSPPVCDSRTGQCRCKQNMEGQNCDRTKPGFFGPEPSLSIGALPCFCFSHSSECRSSSNHYDVNIESNLLAGNDDAWSVIDGMNEPFNFGYDASNGNGLFVYAQNKEVWFNAPKKFLGNQRNSYNQELSFRLKFIYNRAVATRRDVVIENTQAKIQISRPFYDALQFQNGGKRYEYQESIDQIFTVRLNETDMWRPALSFRDFQRLLSNVNSLKIKATVGDYTFLDQVTLGTALKLKSSDKHPTSRIEECTCPIGHTGQFCEQCAIGYTREIPYGDAFVKCVPCSCNNHSISCDSSMGKCQCMHQTSGENCEACKEGYYGNALIGTATDCKKCPCPNDGPCAEFFNNQSNSADVVCLKCPEGTRGNLCDMCDDGYYDRTKSNKAISLTCAKCDCNGNIDLNAVKNCDPVDGKCLRCIYNTTGEHCEKCLDAFWGDALTDLKCHACECSPDGSLGDDCDLSSGQCKCNNNVVGRTCNTCRDRFWNMSSGAGCVDCKCNPLGAIGLLCDKETGKCDCQPGVTGDKCDECLPNYYGFSALGCTRCDCDPQGSMSMQCNELGQCDCKEQVSGDKCNVCTENYYNFTIGCARCDDCYNLVQASVNKLRAKLADMDRSFDSAELPSSAKNFELVQLEQKLKKVKTSVDTLHDNLFKSELGMGANYNQTLVEFRKSIEALSSDFKKSARKLDVFHSRVTDDLAPLEAKVTKSFGDLSLQLTMITVLQQQQSSYLDAISTEYDHTLQSIEIQNPNLIKLKGLARKARETSESQQNLAAEYSEKARNYAKKAVDAAYLLNDLLAKLEKMHRESIDNNAEYGSMTKSAAKLVEQSKEIKKNLDKQVADLKETNAELKNFKMPNYDKEIIKTDERIKEISVLIKSEKVKVDKLNEEFEKLNAKSRGDELKARQNLNQLKIKDGEWTNLVLRSERAKNRTEEGFDMASKAFLNASKIASTLENFEKELQNSKQRANNAENLKKDIEENLSESKQVFENLSKSMSQLKSNNDIVKANLDYIEVNTAKNQDELSKRSSELSSKLNEFNKATNNLRENYDDSSETLENAYNLYTQLPSKLNKLENDTIKLRDDSQALLTKVLNANSTINLYNDLDVSFYKITKSDLVRLTKKYEETVKEIDRVVTLDEQSVSRLEEVFLQNLVLLDKYQKEVPLLKQQIAELTSLKSSLFCRN